MSRFRPVPFLALLAISVHCRADLSGKWSGHVEVLTAPPGATAEGLKQMHALADNIVGKLVLRKDKTFRLEIVQKRAPLSPIGSPSVNTPAEVMEGAWSLKNGGLALNPTKISGRPADSSKALKMILSKDRKSFRTPEEDGASMVFKRVG